MIYRLGENSDEHELIGVEYGADIDMALDDIIAAIHEDAVENNEWNSDDVAVYPPDEEEYQEENDTYYYPMVAAVSPISGPENLLINYWVMEVPE